MTIISQRSALLKCYRMSRFRLVSIYYQAVFFAALVVHLCVQCVLAYAEQRELNTDTSEKVDAILLLDASGSMLKTDPLRLRDEGAKLFIQFLKPGDRLGIIEFSNSVKTIRPLSDYDRAQTDQIAKDVSQVSSNGLYTDLLAGIKAAQTELKANVREDAHQIIVLLSDGKMEPDPAIASASVHSFDIINNILPALKAEGVKVHTLYFSDQADKDILSQIALGTDGVNWFTPTADKVHESFAELFLVVKKPQIVPLAGKSFIIDEDIEEATFYINREEGATVSVESPDGEVSTAERSLDSLKWYSGTKFEVITVEKPKAGKWKITGLANTDGFATVLTDLKLITEWPSSFTAQETVTLQARLYDEKRPVTLPQMTGVVKYGFQIIPTDKVSEPIVRSFLVDSGEEGDKIADDGIYSKSLAIEEPGDYRLTIVAKGPTFTRHQQIPFRVKPRLVSLRIGQASHSPAHGVAGHNEADSHHQQANVHHDHDQPASSEKHEAAAHDDKANDHGTVKHQDVSDESNQGLHGSANDVFQIVLSQEASALKALEVKFSATSADRRRFSLPTTKVSGKGNEVLFEVPATLLPGAGSYQLEASITGLTNKKEHVHASSEVLQYIKSVTAGVSEEHQVVAMEPTKEEVPFSPVLSILLITIINVLSAVGIGFYLNKIIQGGSIVLPQLAPIEPVKLVLASMQERITNTNLDLNDARFAGASEEVGTVDMTTNAKAPQQDDTEEDSEQEDDDEQGKEE
jgi:uncharacterized protein (TIGR03503 family)